MSPVLKRTFRWVKLQQLNLFLPLSPLTLLHTWFTTALSCYIGGEISFCVCQVFDFTLEAEEMKSITALNRGWRYIVPVIEVSKVFTLSHGDGQAIWIIPNLIWIHKVTKSVFSKLEHYLFPNQQIKTKQKQWSSVYIKPDFFFDEKD